jgi:hypothetical protein
MNHALLAVVAVRLRTIKPEWLSIIDCQRERGGSWVVLRLCRRESRKYAIIKVLARFVK